MPTHPDARRGSALIMAVTLTATLCALTYALTDLTVAHALEQRQRQDDLALFAAAESGMNAAYATLRGDSSKRPAADGKTHDLTPYCNGTALTSIDGCELRADVTGYAGAVARWRLRVQATRGTTKQAETFRRRVVEVVIEQQQFSGFSKSGVLHSDTGLDDKGSTSVDWFDSQPTVVTPEKTAMMTAPADPTLASAGLNKTGPVLLTSSDFVTVQKPASVNGQWGTVAMNPVEVPWSPQPASPSVGWTSDHSVAAGSLTHIASWTGGTVTVTGSGTAMIWVDDTLSLGSIGVKYATSAGKLEIYHGAPGSTATGSLSLVGNNSLGDIAHPERLLLMTTYSDTISFMGNAKLGAILIAPQATLQLRGTFDFYGAMIIHAAAVDKITGNPSLHYDINLGNWTHTGLAPLNVIGWHRYDVGFGHNDFGDP